MTRSPQTAISVAQLAAFAFLTATAVACLPRDLSVEHPAELTGRWSQLRPDGSWADTVEYLADGRVRVAAAPVDTSARWSVVRDSDYRAFCRIGFASRSCVPFRLEGDTLVVGEISSPTYYRRVR